MFQFQNVVDPFGYLMNTVNSTTSFDKSTNAYFEFYNPNNYSQDEPNPKRICAFYNTNDFNTGYIAL